MLTSDILKQEPDSKPEVKQTVINEESVKQGHRVRVPNLRGGYRSVIFNNDGVAEAVDDETLEQLKKDFGKSVEVVK